MAIECLRYLCSQGRERAGQNPAKLIIAEPLKNCQLSTSVGTFDAIYCGHLHRMSGKPATGAVLMF
jgi:hypothetical protein